MLTHFLNKQLYYNYLRLYYLHLLPTKISLKDLYFEIAKETI